MTKSKEVREEVEGRLASMLGHLWEQGHGSPAGKERVAVGPDSIAIWLEDVFSPAEREAAHDIEGQRLIQQYAEQLLAAIRPGLWDAVESITGRRIVSGNIRADVDTGHILCFLVLGEMLAGTSPEVGAKPL
jgi:uncharacterized protein YbcI